MIWLIYVSQNFGITCICLYDIHFQLLLVHFGADISAVDNEGNTPLHMCAMNGHEDVSTVHVDLLVNEYKKANERPSLPKRKVGLGKQFRSEGAV